MDKLGYPYFRKPPSAECPKAISRSVRMFEAVSGADDRLLRSNPAAKRAILKRVALQVLAKISIHMSGDMATMPNSLNDVVNDLKPTQR